MQEEADKKIGHSTFGCMGNVRGKVSASLAMKRIHCCVFSVLPHKQENGCFDRTMLCRKILGEIKKIENGDEHSVEIGFPNSGCF